MRTDHTGHRILGRQFAAAVPVPPTAVLLAVGMASLLLGARARKKPMKCRAIREFVVGPRLLLLATVVVLATGCLSIKSYVDPQLPKLAYSDLLARPNPQPVGLTVDFHRNGKPATFGVSRARDEVRAAVERSKLFTIVTDKPTEKMDRLEIVLDNIGDIGDAAAKGMKTGATFGGAGSMVTDGYLFTATFRPSGKEPITKVYRHAIHSTIGSTDGPPGLTPAESIGAAFNKVVEELVLNLLLDLQKEERL
jgi:hypothetical protein